MPDPSTNPYIPQVWHLEPRAGQTVDGHPLMDSTESKLRLYGPTAAIALTGGDYPAHLPSDEDLGITHLNWKTNDGPNWMRWFDARGIGSWSQWQNMVWDFRNRGITLTPWCVPTWTGNHDDELRITDSIIEVSRSMVFNVEYWGDQYFWQGGRQGIVPYIGELRRRHPTAHFTIQYDTRNPDSIHIRDWLPYMDHIIDMSYWPDFGEPMGTVLGRSYHRMNDLVGNSGKTFSYTYPGTAHAYPDWAIDESPIYIFRRGNMTPACVELVQSGRVMTPPQPPEPPVEPPPTEDYKLEWGRLLIEQYERSYRDKVNADVRHDHDIQALIQAGLPIPEVRL